METIADWLASQHPRRTGFYANLARNQFLPKSPAQALAEECPHGMTVEAAQWVLDRLERERKDECSTIPNPTNPTTDTDLIPVPRDVLGAACYIIRKSEHAGSKTAETLREYALAAPTDPAPRYVFGPWVEAGGFGSPFPPDSEFQYAGFPTVRSNPIKSLRTCPIRRAYRKGEIPVDRFCRFVRFDLERVKEALKAKGHSLTGVVSTKKEGQRSATGGASRRRAQRPSPRLGKTGASIAQTPRRKK